MTPNTPVAATDDAVARLPARLEAEARMYGYGSDEPARILREAAATVTSLRAEIERLTAGLAKADAKYALAKADEADWQDHLRTIIPWSGWIDHDGHGDPPPEHQNLAEVRFKDGGTRIGYALDWDQNWTWKPGDTEPGLIVAYRYFCAAELLQKSQQLETAQSEIQKLQAALMYWMPGVTEATDSGHERSAGDDALLLAGYSGPFPATCWGDKAEARVHELEEGQDKLIDFARQVIGDLCWGLYQMDGGGVQELAERLGLIVPEIYDPATDGPHEMLEAGDTWYKYTDLLKPRTILGPSQ